MPNAITYFKTLIANVLMTALTSLVVIGWISLVIALIADPSLVDNISF